MKNDQTDNLKPYKIWGFSILQMMSMVAIAGLIVTIVYHCFA